MQQYILFNTYILDSVIKYMFALLHSNAETIDSFITVKKNEGIWSKCTWDNHNEYVMFVVNKAMDLNFYCSTSWSHY